MDANTMLLNLITAANKRPQLPPTPDYTSVYHSMLLVMMFIVLLHYLKHSDQPKQQIQYLPAPMPQHMTMPHYQQAMYHPNFDNWAHGQALLTSRTWP